MTTQKEDFQTVISLDFGTARSGYAVASKLDGEVRLPQSWPGQAASYIKTPTELLYSPARAVESWGAEAKKKVAQLRRDAKARDYSFFSAFKMALYSSNGHKLQWADGSEAPARKLIVDYLACLKGCALEAARQRTTRHLDDREIRWVLTVPAIWGDAQKNLMREAAMEAGIIGSGDAERNRLLFVLEPEAAAVYCQTTKSLDLDSQPPGTRFMVVDAGGGTVDITVHEITAERGLREVVPGDGGPYGSTYVDVEFRKLLAQKLSPRSLEAFYEGDPVAWIALREAWESTKCGYRPAQNGEEDVTYFDLGGRFYKFLQESHPEVLARLAAEQEERDDAIEIDAAAMRSLFAPVLDGIVEKIEAVLGRIPDGRCDYLLLAGGFAHSPLLKQRIDEAFGGRTKIVHLPDPGAAVVAGAAQYGLSPELIRERRTRLTYGCAISLPFEDGKDPVKKRVYKNGTKEPYCSYRFCTFATIGEGVPVDHPVVHTFEPFHPGQKRVELNFLATRKAAPRYADEDGVEPIGEVTLDLPKGWTVDKGAIEVRMFFGRTEIEVEASHVASGNKVGTRLDFSSTYLSEQLGA